MDILSKISVSNRINALPAAGDVASPVDGNIWYNSTTGKFRKMENGVVSNLDTTGTASYSVQGMNFVTVNNSFLI